MESSWYILIGIGLFVAVLVVPLLPIYGGMERCSPFQDRFFGQCFTPKTSFPLILALATGIGVPLFVRIVKKET